MIAILRGMLTALLGINHIVRDDKSTRAEFRIKKVEAGNIEILPKIEQHETKWPRKSRNALARISETEIDYVLELCFRDCAACVLLLFRIQFEADQFPANGVGRFGEPNG